MKLPGRFVVGPFLLLCAALPAEAQEDTQLWGEFKLSWIKTRHLTYGLDVEPKVLLTKPEGDPGWVTLDLTPSVEYTVVNGLTCSASFSSPRLGKPTI